MGEQQSDDVALVRRGLELWNGGDWDAAIAELDPEVEWVTDEVVAGLGFERTYSGREGVRRFWHAWVEMWESMKVDVEDLIDRGDDVIALVHFRARARAGLEVDQPVAFRFILREGKVYRFQAWWDRAEARRELGLQ